MTASFRILSRVVNKCRTGGTLFDRGQHDLSYYPSIRDFRTSTGTTSEDRNSESTVFETRIEVPIDNTDITAQISVITLNNKRSRNALSKSSVHMMLDILAGINSQQQGDAADSVRALILRSQVPNIFCAGADLKERAAMNKGQVEAWLKVQRSLMDSLSDFPYPTIAALDGLALGGGLEMALACDMRIVNERAKVGLVETSWAIIPGAGGTQRLSRLVGLGRAKEMIFVGDPINGLEAGRLGLANHVTSGDSSAFDKAMELAKKICRRGPKALKLAKSAIDQGNQASLEVGLDIEQAYYHQLLASNDRMEGLQAFIEKRIPIYRGD